MLKDGTVERITAHRLKATAFKGQVSDAQMTALLIVANQYGLNPWTKEIYAFPDKNNGIVPVVGVDGWSRIINEPPAVRRHGLRAGRRRGAPASSTARTAAHPTR
jgi:hypothetical protein